MIRLVRVCFKIFRGVERNHCRNLLQLLCLGRRWVTGLSRGEACTARILAPAAARSAAFQRRSTRREQSPSDYNRSTSHPAAQTGAPYNLPHNGQIVETARNQVVTCTLIWPLNTEIDSPPLCYSFCCFVFYSFLPLFLLFLLQLSVRCITFLLLFALLKKLLRQYSLFLEFQWSENWII